MKVTNWRKKLAATLLAGGMITPAVAAKAANLNENLIANPGFENVDVSVGSYYNAPMILDWNYVSQAGFAYSHDYSLGYGENPVPTFANGGALVGGGHWYFTPGNNGNQSFDDAILQAIDVSTGATAGAIAGGGATFRLSAYFSSYSDQADRAFVQVDFFNASLEAIGTAQISTPQGVSLTDWTQFSTTGTVPAGTTIAQISSWGEVLPGAAGSADGYQDNLDFRILAPAGFAADFDGDGDVDGADLGRWQRGLGITSGATKSQGDANSSGSVNAADLAIWKGQFGSGATVIAAGQVPEPTSIAIAAGGALLLGRRQKT